jgi:chloride channel protein, CIC family
MSFFESIRLKLGSLDPLPILSVLGLISGLLAGGVVVLFRLFIESGIVLWHSEGGTNDFEYAPWWFRLTLPLVGGILVGLVLHKVGKELRQVGVGHVLERMTYHQGYLSWKNAVVQFLVGGMTLATGQSVGREGPGIHLGSSAGSWLGQQMNLPNNSIRVLVGCGTAAAISASFNTPLAGVIFAMEVVMMEYAVTSFIPLILSSVSAAILSRIVFGNNVAFTVPTLELVSLWEIPYFILFGLVVGSIASLFIKLTREVTIKVSDWSSWLKCSVAGACVGVIALVAPQVMGIGYDTVNEALHSTLPLQVLAIAFVGKLLATIICSGMSMPGGIIGPSMFIGAMIGGIMGIIGWLIFPDFTSQYAFYSMIGMAAMMSSVLQAPLAALMALLELTNNPNILLPGMLTLVISNLVVSQLFKQPSMYQSQMKVKGLDMKVNPLSQFLRSVGVAGLMERKIAVHDRSISFQQAEALLENTPRWLLIQENEVPKSLMAANDLARYIFECQEEQKQKQQQAESNDEPYVSSLPEEIDLLKIPGDRQDIASIYLQATLDQALDTMERESVDAIYVFRTTNSSQDKIYGVLTREIIESHYSYKR